jgi:hypothetical protein
VDCDERPLWRTQFEVLGLQRMKRISLNLVPGAGLIMKDTDFINITALTTDHVAWGIR